MTDAGICYCGNYGGGMHTRSARCQETREELSARIAELEQDYGREQAMRLKLEAEIASLVHDHNLKDIELADLRAQVAELRATLAAKVAERLTSEDDE